MAIRYEAYTWSGERVTGVLETDSEEDAYTRLREDELIPLHLRRVRRRRSLVELAPGLFQPKARDALDFTQQMSSLLKSGIPLRRALMIQHQQTRSLGLREALRQVIEQVEGGGQFSDALARHSTVFSDFYVRLVKVGEATGSVAMTLQQVATTLGRRQQVRDKVKQALTYPAISLGVAAVAAFVLVTYSVPALVKLLKEFGGELPLATRLLIAAAEAFQGFAFYTLAGLGGAIVLSVVYMRTARGKQVRDTLLLRLPVVGGIIMASNMFFLTSTLVALLRAGIASIEALRLAQQSMSNVVLGASLAEVTAEATGGTRLGEAFSHQQLFPPLLAQAIAIGEVRGAMVDTLEGLSSFYEQRTEKSVTGATELIAPAVMLLVAGMVGFVAIAVISGIYSSFGTIK